MTTLHFECTFLSDIILNAISATAGSVKSLEYIPGTKFSGIVAKKLYDVFRADATTVFYSGKVRFGDAHLSKNGKRSLKIPFDFFAPKVEKENEKGKILINRLIDENAHQHLRKAGTQLKQQRDGYFVQQDGKNLKLESKSSYSLKSAYNADERRTQDAQIFGYKAIKKGSIWIFSVEIEDEAMKFAAQIKETLCGEHGLGKSRTAQYGRVFIKQIDKFDTPVTDTKQEDNALVLYAESNWCFLDTNGQPTVKPTIQQLGLEIGEIDWATSQIRHSVYALWNVKRSSRDADRWVIDKGSVLVIKNAGTVSQGQFQKGIGLFRSEGFGKVLVNPDFLAKKDFLLEKEDLSTSSRQDKKTTEVKKNNTPTPLSGKNANIKTLLDTRHEKASPQSKISKAVTEFIKINVSKFENITPSQWGQVRSIAQNVGEEKHLNLLLFGEDTGFLYNAKRKGEWSGKARILKGAFDDFKESFKEKQAFLIALASEMAKIAQQKQ